jgi:hypothetical protein
VLVLSLLAVVPIAGREGGPTRRFDGASGARNGSSGGLGRLPLLEEGRPGGRAVSVALGPASDTPTVAVGRASLGPRVRGGGVVAAAARVATAPVSPVTAPVPPVEVPGSPTVGTGASTKSSTRAGRFAKGKLRAAGGSATARPGKVDWPGKGKAGRPSKAKAHEAGHRR